MSKLFKSLGADDAKIQASTKNGAHEAEQRWPIFKAISPTTPAPTVALSDEERAHWNRQEKPDTGSRKPALSMPGLSNKLASGLSKLNGATVSPSAFGPVTRQTATPSRPAKPAVSRIGAHTAGSEHVESTRPLFSRNAVSEASEDEIPGTGLFAKKVVESLPAERDLPDTGGDQSLSGIFGRLEGKVETVKKPASKRTSFLGRLDKG